ncbi:hypothetical protein [Paracoccus aerodenitrificans]|uniref:hypothetical protein n=1 Tax=Paracoccus aerodenitrificans TaxID=3017781 RepID=UPI0022EFE1F1|nr:hypothetical protein [Paracoccus aerodenitrificans]WBU63536.1 hypothetical protein PAE61_14405 [Paracoccus aerodenitrificans]
MAEQLMSILVHSPTIEVGGALNANAVSSELSEIPPDKLSRAVPAADMSTLRARTTRIFQLGFNKCGTSNIYRFLQRSGISATRFNRGMLATRIKANIEAGLKPLAGEFTRFTAFADIHYLTRNSVIEGNRYFREFYQYYPSSYFILNTRNKEEWIRARLAHGDGAYARRYSRALRLRNENEVIQQWSEDWDRHHRSVVDYFADKPGRLLVFDINKSNPQELVNFLAADFITNSANFLHETDTID